MDRWEKENTKMMEASKIRSFSTFLVSHFIKQNILFSLRSVVNQIGPDKWTPKFYFIKN
ncbi:MAG: hypothetical protein OES23_08385 [Nitrosopumilus sp.]|nr:hypothetical protein [Nitrosopumilus sp.]